MYKDKKEECGQKVMIRGSPAPIPLAAGGQHHSKIDILPNTMAPVLSMNTRTHTGVAKTSHSILCPQPRTWPCMKNMQRLMVLSISPDGWATMHITTWI